MEIKRIRIRNFELPRPVKGENILIYKAETKDGKKFTLQTTGNWKVKDVVDAIVKGLTE